MFRSLRLFFIVFCVLLLAIEETRKRTPKPGANMDAWRCSICYVSKVAPAPAPNGCKGQGNKGAKPGGEEDEEKHIFPPSLQGCAK